MITLMTRCRVTATVTSYLIGLLIFVVLNTTALAQSTQQDLIINAANGELDTRSGPLTELQEGTAAEEILTRGQLHEAYAAPHQDSPTPNPLVDRIPPENIQELAPEYQPEGTNVQWIPGYWSWDTELEDFIWISGIWRDTPADRKWEPGYWSAVEDRYRWISGFWALEQVEPLSYLPEPPVSVDRGPTIKAPSQNHFYIPGNWVYQQSRYLWRPGYWSPSVANRIWIPARYIWTPRGCIHSPGYWDYVLAQRGTCFAPVFYRSPVYLNRNYRYSPSCTIRTGFDFMVHLFVRKGCNRYFYGDWYGHRHRGASYRPWHDRHSHHRHYDPMLSYYDRSQVRYNNTSCVTWVRNQHQFYKSHETHRPHTRHRSHVDDRESRRVALGTDFEQFAKKHPSQRAGRGKPDSRERLKSSGPKVVNKTDRGTPEFRKTDNDKNKTAVEDFKQRTRSRMKTETAATGVAPRSKNKPGRRSESSVTSVTDRPNIEPSKTTRATASTKGDKSKGLTAKPKSNGPLVTNRPNSTSALPKGKGSTSELAAKPQSNQSTGADRLRQVELEKQQRKTTADQRRQAILEKTRQVALERQQKLELEKRQRSTKPERVRPSSADRLRQIELEKQRRKNAAEQQRQANLAKTRQSALERQQKLELEKRQRSAKAESARKASADRLRQIDLEKQRRKSAAEQQRQANLAKTRQSALDRKRKMELEQRQRNAKLEQQRQAIAGQQRQRAAELQQRKLAAEKQRQIAAQQQRARQAAIEKQRQQAAQQKQRQSTQSKKRSEPKKKRKPGKPGK